ncbi:hypothetical protein D4Z78_19160 [Okeania hirsuta]|nr:hypothetical protein D4Z78_19160 [Okeania hirsuta]
MEKTLEKAISVHQKVKELLEQLCKGLYEREEAVRKGSLEVFVVLFLEAGNDVLLRVEFVLEVLDNVGTPPPVQQIPKLNEAFVFLFQLFFNFLYGHFESRL